MKKLLLSSLAVAALSLASLSASAATANSLFDVSVALTPVCVTTTLVKPTLTFTYLAFGPAAPSNNTIALAFKCTRNVVLTNAAITGGNTGTVGGLAYTLTLSSAVTGSSGSGNTQADTYTYTIGGNMVSGQSGDVSAPTTDFNRELVISY